MATLAQQQQQQGGEEHTHNSTQGPSRLRPRQDVCQRGMEARAVLKKKHVRKAESGARLSEHVLLFLELCGLSVSFFQKV